MRRTFQVVLGVALITLVAAVPIGLAVHQQQQQKNFRVVRVGVLYRSGQMTLDGLRRAIHDHGIRTVVTLRDGDSPGDLPPDNLEEEYCNSQEVRYVRITPRHWESEDPIPPVEIGVQKFLAVVKDPANHPVLVHCFAGIHRTGAYCAVYRMEMEGWSADRALVEMKASGYDNIEEEWDILGYLTRYKLKHPNANPSSPPELPFCHEGSLKAVFPAKR